jgi:hypothetical protein
MFEIKKRDETVLSNETFFDLKCQKMLLFNFKIWPKKVFITFEAKAQPFQIACGHCKGVGVVLKIYVSVEKRR